MAKAIVLPDPVRLPPMQSLPERISGMQPFWIAVGRVMAIVESVDTSHGCTCRDVNVLLSEEDGRLG